MDECIICGNSIIQSNYKKLRKYCSSECLHKGELLNLKRKRLEKHKSKYCVICKKEIPKYSPQIKYCSKECYRVQEREIYKKNYKSLKRDKIIETGKQRAQRIKLMLFEHYSGKPPMCACCGDSHLVFLSLDHINGRGCKDRADLKLTGTNFYIWLIKNNFPEGFQILCMNCNHAKSNHKQKFCLVHHPELYTGSQISS